MLLSTHILPEVTLICQRVAIINEGRLLAIDSPAGLQQASEQTNRVTFGDDAPADPLREALLASTRGARPFQCTPLPGRAAQLQRVECQVDSREGIEARIATCRRRPMGAASSRTPSSRRSRTFSCVCGHAVGGKAA